jgi:hypothetical protein
MLIIQRSLYLMSLKLDYLKNFNGGVNVAKRKKSSLGIEWAVG